MAKFEQLFRAAAVCLLAAVCSSVAADDYSAGWGPAIGTPMPMLQAPDHSGASRSLANLSGDQGLLLFLNRSADW